VGQGLGQAQEIAGPAGESVRQRITLEPHAGKWLFALDRPLTAPPGATLAPGRYLNSPRPVTRIRRYEVVSAPLATERELRPRERTAFLRLPASVTPEVRALVQSFGARTSEPHAVVKAALDYFRTQGFVYSLAPGAYQGEGAASLDEFLFSRKSGFCEHYAGAFATLMRAAGIPSRVVVGYLGGQMNQFGGYLLVRQSDAHAWCEVWLPDSGWERVDPTNVIAPERASLGSLREMRAAEAQRSASAEGRPTPRAGVLAKMTEEARLAWDTVSFAWDTRVLSFDPEAQGELLTKLHIGDWSGGVYLLGLALLILGLLAAYAFWLRYSARSRPDVLRSLYDQFCLKAGSLGAARDVSEGPADYARRAARLIPAQADRIQKISETYIALRYAPKSASARLEHLVAEVRAFARQ
jgi:transglutaminase-like putative cysteine protease